MKGQTGPQGNRVPRASWLLLAGVTTLTSLNGFWVAITPVGAQTELSGRTWEQFAAADAEVASLYSLDLAMLGMALTAFSILGLIAALIPYRQGERWAWFAMWLLPLLYAGMALRMLSVQYVVGYMYLGFLVLSLIGMVIPMRRFLWAR